MCPQGTGIWISSCFGLSSNDLLLAKRFKIFEFLDEIKRIPDLSKVDILEMVFLNQVFCMKFSLTYLCFCLVFSVLFY